LPSGSRSPTLIAIAGLLWIVFGEGEMIPKAG
jgi:hypothetical protein